MRRMALVAALIAWGCAPQSEAPPDTGDSAGAPAATPCGLFGCISTDNADASLATRARSTLVGCGGMEFCHSTNAAGMTLGTGAEFDATIGVPSTEHPELLRVRPGDPWQSYLYRKVLCEGGISGGCMSGNPDVARMFHDWIEAGAPTN